MNARSLATGFLGGLAVGLFLHFALRPAQAPPRARDSSGADAAPRATVTRVVRKAAESPVGPHAPDERLRVQLDALRATHESLDDRAREAERTVEKLERRIRVLEQELRWARGQEQEYIRAYPEDDIEEVIRIRAQVFMEFGIELDVHEMHEMVRLHPRYIEAARQARKAARGDRPLRWRLVQEAQRDFVRAAEAFLPPEKMERIKERWDHLRR